MSEIFHTEDEIYKAVSTFYKNNRLDKNIFIGRLISIKNIIVSKETMNSVVGWIFALEEIEPDFDDSDVKNIKKSIREELKSILGLLDIKVSRNQLTDLRKVNNINDI